MKTSPSKGPNILIACNNGGHLLQALQLIRALPGENRIIWMTKDDTDSRSMLSGNFIPIHVPTTKNLLNCLLNFLLAIKTFIKFKTISVVVSTGAGIAPPVFLAAKMWRKKTIFIESFSRVVEPSLSARICYRLSDCFYVQWSSMLKHFPKAVFKGPIL